MMGGTYKSKTITKHKEVKDKYFLIQSLETSLHRRGWEVGSCRVLPTQCYEDLWVRKKGSVE